MGVDLPAVAAPFGIDGEHDTLPTELGGAPVDQAWIRQRRSVDRHLVGTGAERGAHVVYGANTPADREGHKNVPGGAAHNVEHGLAAVTRSGDIEEADFVGASRGVFGRQFHGIALVLQVDKTNPFDHPAGGHVQARDDPLTQHGAPFDIPL